MSPWSQLRIHLVKRENIPIFVEMYSYLGVEEFKIYVLLWNYNHLPRNNDFYFSIFIPKF